jgi:hypothetical protein
MRALKISALLIFCIGSPIALWEVLRIFPTSVPDPQQPTHSELVTILLTGVTIVLAILAVFVAGLAVWGYESIKSEAGAVATRALEKTIADAVAKRVSESAITIQIREEIEKIVRSAMEREGRSYPAAFSGSQTEGATPEQVAEEYPGDKSQ